VEESLDRIVQAWAVQLWGGLLDGAGAHPAGAAALDVDSGWMLDEWERELFERLLAQARGGSVRFVESTAGGGRSHFLHMLHNRARRAGMATVSIPACRQAEVWADPLELYRELAQALLPSLSPGSSGFPSLVLSTLAQDIARKELFPEFPSWGLALQLWAEQREPEAERFLLGQPLQAGAEQLGLHAGLSSRQAPAALRCMLCYLDYCGEKGLVAMGDGDGEVEPSRERGTLESLRNLIDSCAGGDLPGLLVVFAVLPNFRQQVLPEYEALQQRLHSGFSLGPAGCLRPILILEEQRQWRASQGIDFSERLFESIHRLATRIYPKLVDTSMIRRNAEAMLEELPWDEASTGAARRLSRTMARWFAESSLPMDSSDPACHAPRLTEFLDSEAL
jgi:hypothetical protein